ncbi:sensor histidine kinase [Polaribacter sp. M15]
MKIDAQNYSVKNLTIQDGLPSNIVYDIQQDKIGYLWIATEKGLVKFDGDDFTLINSLKTTTLFIDGSTIYAGLENGLFIKNKSNEYFIKSEKILSIVKHKNKIYTGTIEGIYSLENKELYPLLNNSTVNLPSVNGMISTEKGIIITSTKGLYKLHISLNKSYLNKIEKGVFTSIDKSYNSYIATESNGKIIEVKNDSILKTIETISNANSIRKIKNEVWVSSKTNGIEVYSLPSFTFKQKINKYNSLQTNTIYDVFKTDDQTTYIASSKGVYVLKNLVSKNTSDFKPVVYFENFQVNHQNADTLLAKKKFILSHLENNISISFKTVNLSYPKKIQYRYQLNDYFSPWTFNNNVQLPNLNAGSYQFKIQSKIENKKSKIKSLAFMIKTPFYQKAWFIFTVVITLLLASYLYLDYYLKQINTRNKQKINQLKQKNQLLSLEHKALQLQMNPHFIFNVLNGIKALGNRGDINELNNTISKFSVLLRGILNNSRKDEISLKDEILLLKNYIELEQKMSSKSFCYRIVTHLNHIDPDEILIPTMLLQPFVENCIKHAFKINATGEITISFSVKHRFLECTIADNGIGIYQSQKRKGNSTHKPVAIKIAKERLFVLTKNSSFRINEILTDNKVLGTKVSFKIPLKTDY